MMNAKRPKILRRPLDPEVEALFHPGQVFDHPEQVVDDPDLTLNEKRAILASWASDACTIEGAPALRRVPGSGQVVSIDDILEALRRLDKEAGEGGASWLRRQVRRKSIEASREAAIAAKTGRPGSFRIEVQIGSGGH